MPTDPEIAVSIADAEAFARRLGLTWASAADIAALREAMIGIARAGTLVPRVASKFTQPAYAFNVAPRTHDPKR
jgi:hypothetical protein